VRRDAILAGYRGHVDAVEPVLSGWVSEIARPDAPVRFALCIDRGDPIPVIADRLRGDVAVAGLAHPNCGFAVELPARFLDGAEHEIMLLLSGGRRLHLPGNPGRVALGPVRADLVPASVAGAAAVVDLLRRTDAEAGFDPQLIGVEHAMAFNAVGARDRGSLFYARAGARLVGYARLDRGQGDAARFGVVALTVLEAYRRKGLGDALMRALLRAAVEGRLREVWLSVRPDNIPAIRLYEKLGFVAKAEYPAGGWKVPGETAMVWLPGHA
jgi:ribosomal protein S18 acetylase RimI-like enzyme